jgi:glycosyltransferase involved in cell wall biosynthesis
MAFSKIAASSIAKNEAKNVSAWLAATSSCNARFVLDTGSTDNTVELLRAAGVVVKQHVFPEPFDFSLARNVALAMVPPEYRWTLAIDFDERLDDDWREKFESAILENPDATMVKFYPVMTLGESGEWQKYFEPNYKLFCTDLHGWRGPCHEKAVAKAGVVSKTIDAGISLFHDQSDAGAAYARRARYAVLCKAHLLTHSDDAGLVWYLLDYAVLEKNFPEIREYAMRYLVLTSGSRTDLRAFAYNYLAQAFAYEGNVQEATSNLMRAYEEYPSEWGANTLLNGALALGKKELALSAISLFPEPLPPEISTLRDTLRREVVDNRSKSV